MDCSDKDIEIRNTMKKGLVVITGASSGIGAETAAIFSKAGYPLLLLARRLQKLKALNLPNALCQEVDVTDLPSFKAALEQAEKEFGRTECLINNAGVIFVELFHKQDPEKWKKIIDVNILGMLNGIHLVLNEMVKRRSGSIINISSLGGRKTCPNFAVYSATKHAVHALTETIREEVASHNVRLINIAPGNVKTEILEKAVAPEMKKTNPFFDRKPDENLEPDDIAKTILFAYELPQNVCMREILICPTAQIG